MKYISVEKGNNIILTKWLCAVTSSEYRFAVRYVLKAIRKAKVDFWLIDATRMSTPALQDQKWTIDWTSAALNGSSLK
ncbi:hypothetical protein OB13_20465, partial [Pontibacter sp. HJ8]